MYEELLQTAKDAALAGQKALLQAWDSEVQVDQKAAFDFATSADLKSEAVVKGLIASRYPGHAILAEESASSLDQAPDQPGALWVVDPLDGTTNFIHGIPHVAVSVAVLLDGDPVAGVICDVTRGEFFWALKGGGAFLGDEPIKVSAQEDPTRSLMLTGFPFRNRGLLATYLELFAAVFSRVSGVRRSGAAALDLAYVACGRAEGFWELGLKPWDVAAGILIVQEAGGVVTDFRGGAGALWGGEVVACAPQMHPWVQGLCARFFPQGVSSP